jgi:hypothetical protein
MLPPFVPPAARHSNETLPLITEFVIDRVEHSFDNSFSVSGEQVEAVVTLPSIDEFVREQPASTSSVGDGEEFVERTTRSPWGTYEAQYEVVEVEQTPTASEHAPSDPDVLLAERTPPSGAEAAVVNDVAESPEAWAPSAASSRTDADTAEPDSGDTEELSQTAPEVWVAEERDAFDWHAVANLAAPPVEDQRAAEEWSSTEWEKSGGSLQDHVATLLVQVSRRVRSGELEIRGNRQMGNEAALVAVLAALLAESTRK